MPTLEKKILLPPPLVVEPTTFQSPVWDFSTKLHSYSQPECVHIQELIAAAKCPGKIPQKFHQCWGLLRLSRVTVT